MGLSVLGGSPNYDYMTSLEAEMRICAEYLHCTHEEFKQLTRDEQLKWMCYSEMQSDRIEYQEKQRELEIKKQKMEQQVRHMRSLGATKGRVKVLV